MKTSKQLLKESFEPLNTGLFLLAFIRITNNERIPAKCPEGISEELYPAINVLLSGMSAAECEAEVFADHWREESKDMPSDPTEKGFLDPDNMKQFNRALDLVAKWKELTASTSDFWAARKWLASRSFEERCCLKVCVELFSMNKEEIGEFLRSRLNPSKSS